MPSIKIKFKDKKKDKAAKPKVTETDVYLLLDRSGSMGARWDESLSSINGYVADLAKRKVAGNAVLALFDENGGLKFEIVRNEPIKNWTPVTSADGRPRGMTPLYDAVGRMVALAERNDPAKAIIVIVTDGLENASMETPQVRAKELLTRCRDRGWQVVMLGVDFENAAQATDLGNLRNQTIASYGASGMRATMSSLAGQSVNYASGASATMSFTDEDRVKAKAGDNKAKARAA